MERLNSIWPFGISNSNQLFNQLSPAHILILQSQMQQQQHNHQQNMDFMNANNDLNQHQAFKSSFSVNSLLNPDMIPNVDKLKQTQNLAAALTQHLSNVVASYRLNHQQKLINQQQVLSRSPLQSMRENQSAFQAPCHKKMKISNENEPCFEAIDYFQSLNPLNSSICSISSPSSSSSSSLFSSSSSFECSNQEVQANSIQLENYNPKRGLNSSDDYTDYCNDKSDYSDKRFKSQLNAKRSNRKRVSIDLENPQCPICHLTLKSSELQSHLDSELAELDKLNSGSESNKTNIVTNRKRTLSGNDKNNQNEATNSPAKNSTILYEVKENRQLRLKNKLCSRMKENRKNKTLLCPLCNKSITDLKDQIDIHLENCSVLLKENNKDDIDFKIRIIKKTSDSYKEFIDNGSNLEKDELAVTNNDANADTDCESSFTQVLSQDENSNDLLKKKEMNDSFCQDNNYQ